MLARLYGQKGMTMNIKFRSAGISDRQAFQITKGGNLGRMKDNVGRTFTIQDYIRYEDEDSDGKTRDLLAIVTSDGDIIATNSSTVLRTFDALVEQFPLPIEDVQIYSDTAKSGREYLNIALV